MDQVLQFVDVFLHLDRHLGEWIEQYQQGIYLILFLIVFCETGLVVTPVLPGDSLLFAAGTFAGMGRLNVAMLLLLLSVAAILGDTVNYWIGHKIGPKVFHKENVRFLNKKHLLKAHEFYEKYGGITIIIARFMPFIRTFAPFVAGIGSMTYWRFLMYNAVGGIAWIFSFVLLGYLFGNIPAVKKNFTFVIMGIVVVSVMPMVIEYIRSRRRAKTANADGTAEAE
ncbi:MAG: DedA family protein [Phycisphaerae bacterium]|jgi:membrane-associated protein